MTVNSLLKAALEPVAPVEADTYEGTEPTYITFGYISTPTDFGDDEPEHELFSISVHLFAPTGEDTIEKRRAIKKALAAAGTTWPSYTNASDKEGQHHVFECQLARGVGGIMGTMSVSGLDDLIGDLDELARLPDSVTDQMLNAEADVIEAAQRSEASRMWKGPYYTGTTAASIKKGKIKRTGLDKSITVAPQGHNKRGTRNAEVAFVNEFGKRGQPGRPALKTANERKEQEAVAAGEKVYHAYLDGKKL